MSLDREIYYYHKKEHRVHIPHKKGVVLVVMFHLEKNNNMKYATQQTRNAARIGMAGAEVRLCV